MLSRSGVPALIGFLALILVLGGVVQQSPVLALDQQAGKGVGQPVEVPFRLTISKHLMVRARINGKGPFNFVLDTGAPALFFTEKVAERAGVAQQKDGWGVCDTFELEGGLQIPKAKVRIDTPFQLEGMNGMGLAGAEIHGLMGYNILAQYRITIDLAGDRMVWRRLDWEPKSPFGIVDKSDSSGQGGLEIAAKKDAASVVGSPSTAIKWSPAFRPAFSAGLPGNTASTVTNFSAEGCASNTPA